MFTPGHLAGFHSRYSQASATTQGSVLRGVERIASPIASSWFWSAKRPDLDIDTLPAATSRSSASPEQGKKAIHGLIHRVARAMPASADALPHQAVVPPPVLGATGTKNQRIFQPPDRGRDHCRVLNDHAIQSDALSLPAHKRIPPAPNTATSTTRPTCNFIPAVCAEEEGITTTLNTQPL